jgi:hypothetical protein
MDYGDFSNPKGSYQNGPSEWPGAINSYLVTPTPGDWAKEIERGIAEFKTKFYLAKPFLPNHPAVKVIEDFINHKNPRQLKVSDKDPITTDSAIYLYDVRRMEEVQKVLLDAKNDPGSLFKGKTVTCVRSLEGQSILGQIGYAFFQFPGEVFFNTTRAMLGSYDGTMTVTQIGTESIILTFILNNTLTWESLTRDAPMAGGYDRRNSDVPHIQDWEIQMTFEFREVIPAKKIK